MVMASPSVSPLVVTVSLNVMRVDPAQGWFDQYGFDPERGTVARWLNANASEAFLRVAVALLRGAFTGILEADAAFAPAFAAGLAAGVAAGLTAACSVCAGVDGRVL